MTRWRRPSADEIMLAYMVLAAIGLICRWLSPAPVPRNSLAFFLITAFLAWRVSRGGWLSRRFLILISCVSYVDAAVARLGGWTAVALIIIAGAQIALLVSPPVNQRTRRPAMKVRARGWAQLVRRPPAWLLPWGLFAGALVTLAFLGNMDFVGILGCRPAASDACTALAEGYPVHWLTASQGVPVISKHALLRDWAAWALLSTSVLYLGWVWLTEPDGLPD